MKRALRALARGTRLRARAAPTRRGTYCGAIHFRYPDNALYRALPRRSRHPFGCGDGAVSRLCERQRVLPARQRRGTGGVTLQVGQDSHDSGNGQEGGEAWIISGMRCARILRR